MSIIRYGAEMLQPYTGTFSFKLTVNIERIFWQKIALMPNNWLKMHGYPMRRRVMGRLKAKRKRLVCHKCNKKGGKHYLVYKDGYGWVCPECGYQKEVKEWKDARI